MNSDMQSPLSAHKVISFTYILAKELDDASSQLSVELQPLVKEGVEWRVDRSFKQILKLPFKEKKKFYRVMKERTELRRFVMAKADWKSKIALSCPICVYLVHPFVSLLMKIHR